MRAWYPLTCLKNDSFVIVPLDREQLLHLSCEFVEILQWNETNCFCARFSVGNPNGQVQFGRQNEGNVKFRNARPSFFVKGVDNDPPRYGTKALRDSEFIQPPAYHFPGYLQLRNFHIDGFWKVVLRVASALKKVENNLPNLCVESLC